MAAQWLQRCGAALVMQSNAGNAGSTPGEGRLSFSDLPIPASQQPCT